MLNDAFHVTVIAILILLLKSQPLKKQFVNPKGMPASPAHCAPPLFFDNAL